MSSSPRAPAATSWLALLTALTLGTTEVDRVQAHISGGEISARGNHRLVLQSYSANHLDAQGLPGPKARPLGSFQRAVSAEELVRGVAVSLVQLGEPARDTVLVAWVEPGDPVLELDARTARPTPEAALGIARKSDVGPVSIVLQRPG